MSEGSWKSISNIQIDKNELVLSDKKKFLKNTNQFIGFNGSKEKPKSILIKNNNLHIDIIIDSNIGWKN